MPFPDSIVHWIVRVPGETSWSEHKSEKAAHKECKKANQIIRPGHKVFAAHKSGNWSGPYYPEEE